jgi:hypothetical protein
MSDLIIRTALDDSGLNQQLNKLHRKFSSAFRSFRPVAIPVAAVAGIALLASKLADVGEAAANAVAPLHDMAFRTGLTAERLQELRIIAEQTGGSADALDAGLVRLNANLGKIATGVPVKEFTDAMTSIGVKFRDAEGNALSVGEVWDNLTERVSSGALTQQQAVGAATAAFGRNGQQLVETLTAAREQQQAIIDAARAVGAIIPNEAVRRADEYADRLALINKGTQALQLQRDLALAPLAVEWAKIQNSIAQAVIGFTDFIGLTDSRALVELERDLADMNTEIEDLLIKISGARYRESVRVSEVRLAELEGERVLLQSRIDELKAAQANARSAFAEDEAGAEDDAIATLRARNEFQLAVIESAKQLEENEQAMDMAEAMRRAEDRAFFDQWEIELKAHQDAVRENQNENMLRMIEAREQLERREQEMAAAQRARTRGVIADFADAFGALSDHSKRAFKISKALSIANAIVNTHEAVTAALAAKELPVFLRFAMAAAAAAKGAAQVAAIKRTEFGSGTTPTVAGTPTVNGFPVAQQQTLRVVGINASTLLSGDAVRDLAQRLLDFQRDGGKVVLTE